MTKSDSAQGSTAAFKKNELCGELILFQKVIRKVDEASCMESEMITEGWFLQDCLEDVAAIDCKTG